MHGRAVRLTLAFTTVFVVVLGLPVLAQVPTTELTLRSEMDGGSTYAEFDIRVNEHEVGIRSEGRARFRNLPAGPVEVAIPAPPAPFEVRSLLCRDPELPYEEEVVVDLVPDADGAIAATIDQVGSEIHCTVVFGRADTGVLVIELDSFDSGLAGSFDYRLNPGLPFDAQLTTDTRLRSLEAGTAETFGGLEPGPWTLALEGLPPDWEPERIECSRYLDEGGRTASAPGANLLFELEPGYSTGCTIWVAYVEPLVPAALGIEVDSFELDLEGDFAYSLEQGLGLEGLLGSSTTAVPIEPDVWTIREGLAPGGWTLTLETLPDGLVADAECWDAFGPVEREAHDPTVPGSGRTVWLDLRPGTTTDCSFWIEEAGVGDVDALVGGSSSSASRDPAVSPEPSPVPEANLEPDDPVEEVLAPKPGRWRSVVAASSIVCGGRSVAIPKSVDSGPIQVKNGGRRIIVAADPARIVLDQVEGEPGHYKGTVKERSTGQVVKLRYDVRVLDPERMRGTLRANFTAEGTKCTLKRAWNSRYVGK